MRLHVCRHFKIYDWKISIELGLHQKDKAFHVRLFHVSCGMTWQEKVARWRELKPAERKARRWADIPRQVAASMAFEGEPVDIEWLKTLHNRRTPRAS